MKHKTMTEILEDKSLSLPEIHEAMWKFLETKGMSMEEFMMTAEGQKILKMSEEDRFTHP